MGIGNGMGINGTDSDMMDPETWEISILSTWEMSTLSTPINKTHITQWTQFAQTIKIPKEYYINNTQNTHCIKQLKFKYQNDNQLRKVVNQELQSLKQQISLPSELNINKYK